MGTTYRVVIAGKPLDEADAAKVRASLDAELDRINRLMSTYRSDSELSRFNELRSTAPFAVSHDTAVVVQAALDISRESEGAFDVTVRALVAAWGFGAGAAVKPPTDDELVALRSHVGYRLIEANPVENTLTKRHPEASVDLSAIAKGYAVDRLSELLMEAHPNHMVEVGGEVKTRGRKVDGSSWQIGIEQPDAESRTARRVVFLGDAGMATSGDYRNYYEENGVRRSHTIDPRTGKPITHRLASVSVVHETAMMADGYATALNVLGPEEGFALAERLHLAAFFITRQPDGGFLTRSTAAMEALLRSIETPQQP